MMIIHCIYAQTLDQFFIHLVVPVYNVNTRAVFYYIVMGVYRKLNLTPVFPIFSLVKICNESKTRVFSRKFYMFFASLFPLLFSLSQLLVLRTISQLGNTIHIFAPPCNTLFTFSDPSRRNRLPVLLYLRIFAKIDLHMP